jgi:WD40 repeat protein
MAKFIGDVRIISGFDDWIVCSQWMNSTFAVACSTDGKLYSLHCNSLDESPVLKELISVDENISRVSLSGDKKLALAETINGELLLFEIVGGTGKSISLNRKDLQIDRKVGQSSISLDRRGSRLAFSSSKSVTIWSLKTSASLSTLNVNMDQCVLEWGNNDFLAGGGTDGAVTVWHTTEQTAPIRFNSHREAVCCLAWDVSGHFLASGSRDKTAAIFCPERRQILHQLSAGNDWVTSIAFNPSGTLLAVGGFQGDRAIRVWDVAGGDLSRTLTGHQGGVMCLAWNAAGSMLLSGAGDSTMRLWAIDASSRSSQVMDGHDDGVRYGLLNKFACLF